MGSGVQLQLHPFLTFILDRGLWLGYGPPGKEPPVLIKEGSVWAPEQVWTPWRRDKSAPDGNRVPARSPPPYRLSYREGQVDNLRTHCFAGAAYHSFGRAAVAHHSLWKPQQVSVKR
jgi:hypothetical protein